MLILFPRLSLSYTNLSQHGLTFCAEEGKLRAHHQSSHVLHHVVLQRRQERDFLETVTRKKALTKFKRKIFETEYDKRKKEEK